MKINTEEIQNEDNPLEVIEDELDDYVQILDTVDDVEDGAIEAELETYDDINGDEAAFVEIESGDSLYEVEEVYTGDDDSGLCYSDDINDDVSIE